MCTQFVIARSGATLAPATRLPRFAGNDRSRRVGTRELKDQVDRVRKSLDPYAPFRRFGQCLERNPMDRGRLGTAGMDLITTAGLHRLLHRKWLL